MLDKEMWEEYRKINPNIGKMDSWQFGCDADLLAQLVLLGEKTATASGYDLYEEDDPLPQIGTFDVVLDSQDQAVCIIEITKVSLVPFNQVSKEHAYKEGEGDKTLEYWRKVHQEFFIPYYCEVNKTFDDNSVIVLEEFRVVYPEKKG